MQSDADWKELDLGAVIELKRGYDLPKRKRSAGVIPIVSSSGTSDYHSEAKVKGPGVVTGRYGTIGEVFYIESDFWPLNTTLYVSDFKGSHPRFIGYLLKTLDFGAYSDKAAVPGINRNHLHRARVKIPALEAQKAIAHVLGTLDSKIDLNRRINQTLEAMAQAIFKSWFVDFDPVKAKIAAIEQGEDPLRAAMRAISGKTDRELDQMPREQYEQLADTAALFPDEMEESELGEIPGGWRCETVGRYFELTMGQSPPGVTYNAVGEGVPFYQGRTDFGMRFPTERVYCTAPTRLAKRGDVLVSVRAPVGDINVAISDCAIGRGVAAIRHEHSSFALYVLHHQQRTFKRFEADGTVFGSINKKQFESLLFIAAPDEIVLRFQSLVEPFDERIKSNEKEVRHLAVLRDILLPKLLAGEVWVADLDEEAAVP